MKDDAFIVDKDEAAARHNGVAESDAIQIGAQDCAVVQVRALQIGPVQIGR